MSSLLNLYFSVSSRKYAQNWDLSSKSWRFFEHPLSFLGYHFQLSLRWEVGSVFSLSAKWLYVILKEFIRAEFWIATASLIFISCFSSKCWRKLSRILLRASSTTSPSFIVGQVVNVPSVWQLGPLTGRDQIFSSDRTILMVPGEESCSTLVKGWLFPLKLTYSKLNFPVIPKEFFMEVWSSSRVKGRW